MDTKEITTTIERAGYWAIFLFLGSLLLGVVFHLFLWWGNIRDLSLFVRFFPGSLFLLPLFLVLGMIMHELLHALVISVLAPSGWRAVRFGFLDWMTPYCHSTESLSVNGYRLVLLFPFIVLGLGPWVWGLLSGIIELTIWGAIFISSAGGDLLVLYLIRNLPGRLLIQDHPNRVGVRVKEKKKKGGVI